MTREELVAKWDKDDRTETEQAIRALLATAVGRRLLRRWLSFGKLGVNPFAPNALTMSFSCGELNVGQQMLADILAIDPDGWIAMQKEENYERQSRERDLTNAGD